MIIQLDDVTKIYETEGGIVPALRGVNLTVDAGEFLAITGPSGSGKSTMLHILGCLDVPSSGKYLLEGLDVGIMDEDELADIRSEMVGFVFQSYNLLPRMRAIEQVELPLMYARVKERRGRAEAALEAVGLADRASHMPNQLSGGQQQRVAIARCVATRPAIVLADEPTGALDTATGDHVMTIFERLTVDQGITVIVVTHEPAIAARTRRTVAMRDGLIVADGPSKRSYVA